ncbi:hypothetical protein [Alkalihalobacterium elongatum]|uniref:hypothetical protein n=1 Tax=Alkalihalobacterium elongatum TaxID=2675466 RepID=UPI001C1FFB3E|nr:hypothetical protein [Alkalihalobacterium elongatum]
MVIITFTLPLVAIASMIFFTRMNWTSINFLKNPVPYSIGFFVLYSYLIFAIFSPWEIHLFSGISIVYLLGLWLIGLIDDIFGEKNIKGLKGHIGKFIREGSFSTALLKLTGTLMLAYIWISLVEPVTLEQWVRYSIILILTPHVMNLFDTRPLRVWKVSLLHVAIFLPYVAVDVPFAYYLFLLSFFFLFYVLDGHAVAMLGDNGATLMGGILAVVTVMHAPIQQQYIVIILLILLTVVAERVSFTKWIEKHPFMKILDQWGLSIK